MRESETSSPPSDLLNRAAAATERFVARYSYLALAIWTAAYFAATFYRASRKLFWFDEIFTSSIARAPHIRDIWRAATDGTDYNPPLLYLITRFSESVIGPRELGARMPEMIAFFVFCLCLYRFVSIRTTALTGLVSMSFPVVTTTYYYAYEARSHGLVLGFAGLALVSWQAAADRTSRRLWPLIVLGLSLACALLTHGYAFVVFVPMVVGEFVRFLDSRRADRAMWLTLALAAAAILVSVPIFASIRATMPPSFFRPRISTLLHTYQAFFAPATAILCLTIGIAGVAGFRGTVHRTPVSRGFKGWELAAAVAALLIPAVVFIGGYMARTPVLDRYSLFAVAGLACLIGAAISLKPIAAIVCLVVIGVISANDLREFRTGSAMTEPSTGMPIPTRLAALQGVYEWMESDLHRDLPIEILDGFEFATLFFYAPPSLKSRLVVISSGDYVPEEYILLQRCCQAPGRVLHSRDLPANARLLAYGTTRFNGPVYELLNQGASVSLEKVLGDRNLYLVQYGSSPSPR